MQVAKQALREGGASVKRKGRGNGRNKEVCADWSPLVPGGDAASAPGQAAVWWTPEQDGVFRAALYGNPGAPTAPQVCPLVMLLNASSSSLEGRSDHVPRMLHSPWPIQSAWCDTRSAHIARE